MADDDRPRFSGRVPASGAPLNARTLALRPGGQSLAPGDANRTSSDFIADAVYSFLQNHPSLGVPEQGQQNLAEAARSANQLTPWGSTEEAINSAKQGDIVGTSTNLLGAVPILGAASKGVKVGKEAAETVASTLAKRAVIERWQRGRRERRAGGRRSRCAGDQGSGARNPRRGRAKPASAHAKRSCHGRRCRPAACA